MAFELSDADKIGMTPDEIASLTGPGADKLLAAHGGQDEAPPADDDAPTSTATPEPAADPSAADASLPGADELADMLAEDAPAPTTAPKPFKVEGPADYKAERQALRTEAADVEAKWSSGELSDEERASEIARIEDARDDLLIRHTRAETLRNANEQQAADTQASFQASITAACTSIAAGSKAAGLIDYGTDTKAAKQFDNMLTMLVGDPDNASKSAAELTRDAHRSVLALRGLSDKPAAATPAAPAPPARRDVPRATLADLPSAAPVGLEDGALDKFSTLEGEDAEDYLASLPKSEQDRILRAADKGSMMHSNDSRTARRSRAA